MLYFSPPPRPHFFCLLGPKKDHFTERQVPLVTPESLSSTEQQARGPLYRSPRGIDVLPS